MTNESIGDRPQMFCYKKDIVDMIISPEPLENEDNLP